MVILRFFLIYRIGKLTLIFAKIRCDAAIYIRKDLKSTFSRVRGQFFSVRTNVFSFFRGANCFKTALFSSNLPSKFSQCFFCFVLFCFCVCVCVWGGGGVEGGSEETSTFTQSLLVTYKRDSVKLSRHKSVHLQRNKHFCKEKNKLFNLNHLKYLCVLSINMRSQEEIFFLLKYTPLLRSAILDCVAHQIEARYQRNS